MVNTLKILEDGGYISVERRFKDNVKTSSVYTMNPNVQILHKGSEIPAQPPCANPAHRNSHSFKQPIKHIDQTAFDQWWSLYPKKVGKKPALTIWKRIKPDAELLVPEHKTKN